MKKNIGLLIPSMNSGGAERVVSRLSHILSADYNIFVIMFEDTYMKYDCAGTIINMGINSNPKSKFFKNLLPIKRAIMLRKIKKTNNLSAVISFLDSPNVVNILSRTNNCKVIISIRNHKFPKNNELAFKMLKSLYRNADSVVSVSKVITEKMVNKFSISKNKAITIYNPYDVNEIKNHSSEMIDEANREFFSRGFIFISIGRITYQKGFWHLVKAFKIVHDNHPEAKLVIIGRDESEGKTHRLVKELEIEKSVLITGFIENPLRYISRSSAYVLSSLFEGFPNALVEAMACGCPVIAADCKSGPREILYDNTDISNISMSIEKADNGILVPPLDSGENWDCSAIHESEKILANAMIMLINDIQLREYYSRMSVARAKEFSNEICMKEYKAVIEGQNEKK